MSKVLAVVGPTATGKTRRAVSLARALGGEVVSADSRQVYRGMDVGTGKDLADYGSDVPYHLIDIVDAGTKYNLFEFLRDCRAAVADIAARGRLPIVCGGTGMYVEAFVKGVCLPEVPRNEELRASLAGKSLEELSAILASMKRLHNTTDVDTPARAMRAIEIERYYLEHPEEASAVAGSDSVDALVVGIDIDRDTRRALISERLRRRLTKENMLDEIHRLLDSGIDPEALIYYGLEYKYLTLHVLGRLSRHDMEVQLETAIHQFAKRQATWFRGMERRGIPIHWLPYDMAEGEFVEAVKQLM